MYEIQSEYDNRPLREQTMNSVLENRASHLGEETFLHYGPEEREITFSQLDQVANQIGNSLRELGVEPQQKVSVMMRDPLQTLFAMFGIHKAGAVFSPINFEYEGDVLAYQINDTEPEVLFLRDEYVPRLNAISSALDDAPHIVLQETDTNTESPHDAFSVTYSEDLRSGDSSKPDVELEWYDEASIIYTSGTTGMPKGVLIPHRWIFGNYARNAQISLNEEDTVHSVLPLYHVTGLYYDVTASLIAGGSVALWDRFSRSNFWDRVEKYQATRTVLLSVMQPWLVNQPEREDDRWNTLNKVNMTPLPDNYEEIARRFGFDFLPAGYGQTECGGTIGGLVHAARGDDATPEELRRGMEPSEIIEHAQRQDIPVVERVPGDRYLGEPDSLFDVAAVDEHDEEVAPGETGELVVRPKVPGIILKEYYGKPEATANGFRNAWWHTGDAVYRDESGNYFFVDRMGDVIRRRGENISSMQIQDIANRHEKVEKNAVYPIPAEEGGEDEIGMAVEVAEGQDLTRAEVRAFLEEELPDFMQPDDIRIVEEIPTTETNKMQKYKLRN